MLASFGGFVEDFWWIFFFARSKMISRSNASLALVQNFAPKQAD